MNGVQCSFLVRGKGREGEGREGGREGGRGGWERRVLFGKQQYQKNGSLSLHLENKIQDPNFACWQTCNRGLRERLYSDHVNDKPSIHSDLECF